MKKVLALTLSVLMLLGLLACGGETSENNATNATTATTEAGSALAEGQILVGYGRADLTPSSYAGITLVGYGGNGTPPTPMTGVLDRVYGTCVAITDSEDNTVLIYTLDTLYTTQAEVDELRQFISAKTGVPGTNVVVSATHTHASMTFSQIPDYFNKMTQAAVDAMADRAAAKVYAGHTDIEKMNYVRHYVTQDGTIVGDNFSKAVSAANPRVSHTTDADKDMPMIRFEREGDKKDILLVNWQAHPKVGSTAETASGLAQRSMLSADFIGWARMAVEKQLDCNFAYFTGAAGNLNGISWLPEERSQTPELVNKYGEELARQLIDGMANMKEVSTGKVLVQQQKLDVVPIISTATSVMEITAIRVGDIAFVTVPFEMFDTNGKWIKDNSPCENTMVLTCAHMVKHEYIPSEYMWDYNTGSETAYEMTSVKHERGTAEKVSQALVDMLKALS